LSEQLHGPGCNGVWDKTDQFLKRVRPEDWNWEKERPNSGQFTNPKMSTNWSALASVQQTTAGRPDHGVVSLTRDDCYQEGQAIKYGPIKDDPDEPDNPAHCDIIGEKKRGRVSRRLAAQATVCLLPAKIDQDE
jgi:hypothetical protein